VVLDTDEQEALTGRNALVTGGSGGIGAALARSLAARGVNVALSYRGEREAAERLAEEFRSAGLQACAIQSDLSAAEAPAALVTAAEAELGSIDILVANAGVGVSRPWQQVDPGLWDETLTVNLSATFQLTQLTLGAMVSRGFGRVLYVSSIAAFTGGRVVGPHYAASKAGLHGLVYHLAPEVAPYGVTVNAIAPALIDGTRIIPAELDRTTLAKSIPVGRMGSTGEVAAMAMAMLQSPYLTNKVIAFDGGLAPL
jgi:3-oxoacyl-[acyl-carrier protein] reductase